MLKKIRVKIQSKMVNWKKGLRKFGRSVVHGAAGLADGIKYGVDFAAGQVAFDSGGVLALPALGVAAAGHAISAGLNKLDEALGPEETDEKPKSGAPAEAPHGYYNPPRNFYHLNDMGTGPYGQSFGAYNGPIGSNANTW
jgi:hypothetical protein